ncbi:MAG TPA: carboxymuconolactone decarboxylase family protein [Falsiroseomonas sp.]|nr:carboxymuconolactone decarboxylase family protein [Falsiroseomonas sp.]
MSGPEWEGCAGRLAVEQCLDRRIRALISLAVAASLRCDTQLLLGIAEARAAGAARDEVIGAILAAAPVAGVTVLAMLPPAARAFDEPYLRGQD